MSLTAAELDTYWRGLAAPSGLLLEARNAGRWPAGQILTAIDTDRRRHLLVAVPDQPRVTIARLRGMDSSYRQLRVAGREGVWLDLQLLDDQGTNAFTLLSADIIAAVVVSEAPDPAVIAAVVRRWRRFWSAVPESMDRESRLGLFGELWLLTRWLPDLTAAAVTSWQGPLGGRHDFANAHLSAEVKTSSAATGPLVHRITGLDQLAGPEQGQLYLLSLRVVADSTGIHSLDGIITEARSLASQAGPSVADDLDERLERYGWTPVHASRYSDPWRVASQILYRVEDGFPRLIRESVPALPPGVIDVRYSLDTSACSDWEVATDPAGTDLMEALARPSMA